MKQTVKKLLFMLGIMCLTIFGKETSTTVLADNLDEIENYTIYAEPDWEDGSVYLKYDITWKVLDSDTDGPLEWVKIGIPNSNVEEIEGYSSNIENIRYYKNGGSYVRIDFDRKYYEGETVEFSFGIHQHHLYQTIDGMRVYRFTPGWFDEIVVDELKFDEIKTKKFQDVLNNLSVSKALVVLEDGNKNAELSARNIADVKTAKTNTINVYDILKYNTVIATKAAVQAIEEVYA